MKNNAVLNRFGTYCGWTALGLASIYAVTWSTNKLFGDPAYGILLVFSIFGMFVLWHMAESSVASEERQKRWDREEELRKKERAILKG
jgi:hypothetical protein